MNDRTGFFVGLADSLTALCAYYVAAGLLIIGNNAWGVHLAWLLLCASASASAYAALLQKPRGTPVLAALTGGLLLAELGIFLLASRTPLYFGYLFVLLIGAGMAVGVPLYYTLRRPTIAKHLAHLDVLIILLAILLLTREALGIGIGTAALMTAVLLMDAAGAVGLRMSDGAQDAKSAFRGTLMALAAAAALSLVILLLTAVFSRSASVTGGVLGGLGAFLAAIGGGIERFFQWLTSFASPVETEVSVVPTEAMPSVASAQVDAMESGAGTDARALGALIVVVLLAGAAAAVVILRKRRVQRNADKSTSMAEQAVRRTGGTASILWARLRRALHLRLMAFILRDTPGGLLFLLERLGKRRHTPRREGESMRQFIRRMDGSGGLDALSDALDAEYYGGAKRALSAGQCRRLRKYMRKAVQHG